jgi:type I restriction enzyme S subunit
MTGFTVGVLTPVKLSDIGVVVTGATPSSKEPGFFGQRGTPFLTPSDIGASTRHAQTERFISDLGRRSLASRIVPERSVCFVCIGSTIGKMCMTTESTLTNQQINSIIVDEAVAHPTFVYYALRQRVEDIRSIAGGSATPIINKSAFESLKVDLLPLGEQQLVAGLLDAIDDKIESNTRSGISLSQLGSALFTQSLEAARAEMTLDELAEHRPGKYLAREAYEPGNYVVYGSNSVMGRHKEALYDGPLVILARIGSNCGALQWSERGAWVNNNASALVAHDGVSPWVLWHVLKSVDMQPFRAGSGQPFVQINDLMQSSVTVPPMGKETLLSESLRSMSIRAESLREESQLLVQLRDSLLPDLLAGRIRVHEGEQVVAGVGA